MSTAASTMARMGRKRRPPPTGRTLRIKFARNLHRLADHVTNRDIADHLGVSERTVGRWMAAADTPDMDLWSKLARFLKCKVADFFQE